MHRRIPLLLAALVLTLAAAPQASAAPGVKFGLTDGQKDAETLGYIPLPPEVVTKATSAIQNLSTQ